MGRPIVVIHPKGTSAAAEVLKVKALLAKNRRVILLEPCKAPPVNVKLSYDLTFQRSDAAERTQDILTALP